MFANDLVCESDEQKALIARLDRLAANDAEVMILGPSGVGKELYAEYIHRQSPYRSSAFVALNCANVAIDTLENELFGHARGAFTGAASATHGIVAAAAGGTLFLDEVNSLSLACQAKLLRFVQFKEYRRLGESFTRKVKLRLICASNCDLRQMVAAGTFREDLFFRLHVLPVTISPLRDRPADVEALIAYFRERYAAEYALPVVEFDPAALAALTRHDWPGNVRELENSVRYLTCLDLGRPVRPDDLPFAVVEAPVAVAVPAMLLAPPAPAEEALRLVQPELADLPLREAKSLVVGSFERAYVEEALDRTSGNVAKAARTSGKHRRAFFELIRRYGIDPDLFRRKAG